MCGSHSCVVLSALPTDKGRGKVRKFSLKAGKNVVIGFLKTAKKENVCYFICFDPCNLIKKSKSLDHEEIENEAYREFGNLGLFNHPTPPHFYSRLTNKSQDAEEQF